MGWFDEQLRKRYAKNQEIFQDSLVDMASSILGSDNADQLKDAKSVAREELEEILDYYHFKTTEIPDSAETLEDQMEYALRPHGLMHRKVTLGEKWLKEAYGPMIAFEKETGKPVTILPKSFYGYYYRDDNGSKHKVTKAIADRLDGNAICFYKPLPLKTISIKDLIVYLFHCLSASDIIFLIAITLIVTMVGKLLPRFNSFLTGVVAGQKNLSMLLATALFLVATLVSSQLFNTARELLMSRLETKTSLSVEAAMMMRLMSLPAPFFRKYSSGELASRSQAVNQLSSLLLGQVFSLGITSVCSLLYITDIFRYAPVLVAPALLTIAGVIAVMLVTAFMQMRITRLQMESQAKERGMSFAMISGVQKIKLSGAERRAFSRWASAYAKTAAYTYNPPFFLKISSAVQLLVSLIGTIALYTLAVQNGNITPSDYLGFNTAFGMLMGAFSSLAAVAVSVAQINPILEMAEPILKEVPEAAENKTVLSSITGKIELSHVSFRYNENMPYVINDLSLKIRAGEYVAIVGRTGCGKSTLVRLLLGFETPEKGSIYYDNKDMKKFDLRSLRRKIGVVMQNGSLFQGNIYSNIVISAPHLSMKDAWEAAETAGIASDIKMMPMGMSTVISEGQGGISGGQKQRLMIARAIAPKPKLLIFDEATSALDNRTQKRVSEALDALNCTRIVIAHRLSTIRNCDRILVLSDGNIIEDGTYDELIEKGGYFAELVERQRLDLSAAPANDGTAPADNDPAPEDDGAAPADNDPTPEDDGAAPADTVR